MSTRILLSLLNKSANKYSPAIYILYCKGNNKFYVGQTVNPTRRFSAHKRDLELGRHTNTYLKNAFNKYGLDNFVFGILTTCERGDLNEMESYIESWFPGKFRFNEKTCGNDIVFTKAARKKMSLAHLNSKFFNEEDGKIVATPRFFRSDEQIRERRQLPSVAEKYRRDRILRDDQVVLIKQLYNEGRSGRSIAQKLELGMSTVADVINEITYQEIGPRVVKRRTAKKGKSLEDMRSSYEEKIFNRREKKRQLHFDTIFPENLPHIKARRKTK